MADPFVAEIRIFGFNFAPVGWALCEGQILPISQNTALFSLLGTTYGGNGTSTFALPNLKGRVPMHPGQGPGLEAYDLGEEGGSSDVMVLESEMPAHNHNLKVFSGRGTNLNTAEAGLSLADSQGNFAYGPAEKEISLSVSSLDPAGSSLPHNNMMPYLAVNYCIALIGIFPPRN